MLKLNSALRQRKMRHPKCDLLYCLYRNKNNSIISHYKVQPSVEIVLKFYEYLNNIGSFRNCLILEAVLKYRDISIILRVVS